MRDAFIDWDGRGQFAGHETFPLRLLWLKKALDAVGRGVPIGFFHEPDAIVRFGVGRNMAVSMRHWAFASRAIVEKEKKLVPTELGESLFGAEGWDPYLERASTVWLVHWNIASTPETTTTIYYAFNAVPSIDFEVPGLVKGIEQLVAARKWRATTVTIRRDIEVLLRSYVRKREEANIDDAAEPLLAELGLIREVGAGGWYEFVRGPKPSLTDGIFAYAVNEFWSRFHVEGASTLSAEQICYAPGSPGRVFKLDENSVAERLMRISEITDGAWIWTETAGLRQIQRVKSISPLSLLEKDYERYVHRKKVA